MWAVSRAEPVAPSLGLEPTGREGEGVSQRGGALFSVGLGQAALPGCTGVGQVGLGSLWHQGRGWLRGRGWGRDRCLWEAAGQAGATTREVEGGAGPLPASMDGAVLQRRW